MFDPKLHSPSDLHIPECPPAGEGCHRWMFLAVNILVDAGLDRDDIVSWTEHWMTRAAQPREIENTYERVKFGGGRRESVPRHDEDPTAIAALTAEGPTSFAEIEEMSPINPKDVGTDDYLNILFGGGKKTILFTNERSQGQLVWSSATPRGLADQIAKHNTVGAWFLLNPVNGEKTYVERLRKISRRSEENLTHYTYALVESDKLATPLWLTILKQLSLPIVSIVLSGNESAHSIVQIQAPDRDKWMERVRALAEQVIPLGACQGSLTAVRLTRLPNTVRKDTRKEQRLLYLNPTPSLKPLSKQRSG